MKGYCLNNIDFITQLIRSLLKPHFVNKSIWLITISLSSEISVVVWIYYHMYTYKVIHFVHHQSWIIIIIAGNIRGAHCPILNSQLTEHYTYEMNELVYMYVLACSYASALRIEPRNINITDCRSIKNESWLGENFH